jgi:glutaredoxin
MSREGTCSKIAELIHDTAEAHHQAFQATEGVDPEWPMWYGDHLHPHIQPFLVTQFTKSRLIHCLVQLDDEYNARDPEVAWNEYYARHLVERYGVADSPQSTSMALYHFSGCPFCTLVRRTIDRLDVEVELRDINRDPQHAADLLEARGRTTVPVMRISEADGHDRWMSESADIVRYLESTYSHKAA